MKGNGKGQQTFSRRDAEIAKGSNSNQGAREQFLAILALPVWVFSQAELERA